jgi:hypothetical protein
MAQAYECQPPASPTWARRLCAPSAAALPVALQLVQVDEGGAALVGAVHLVGAQLLLQRGPERAGGRDVYKQSPDAC